MNAIETIENISTSKNSTYDVNDLELKCYSAMDDDFNTPILIAHLFEGVRVINSAKDGKESLNDSDLERLKNLYKTFVTDILGLISTKESTGNNTANYTKTPTHMFDLYGTWEALDSSEWIVF